MSKEIKKVIGLKHFSYEWYGAVIKTKDMYISNLIKENQERFYRNQEDFFDKIVKANATS